MKNLSGSDQLQRFSQAYIEAEKLKKFDIFILHKSLENNGKQLI